MQAFQKEVPVVPIPGNVKLLEIGISGFSFFPSIVMRDFSVQVVGNMGLGQNMAEKPRFKQHGII